MSRALAFLTFIAFHAAVGCGGAGDDKRRGGSSDNTASLDAPAAAQTPPEDDPEDAAASEPAEVSGAFLVGCGPTREAPADFVLDGEEALGCAVLDPTTGRKTTAPVIGVVVSVNLGAESIKPAQIPAATANWHVFIKLPVSTLPQVERYEVVASFEDRDPVQITSADAQPINPEGIESASPGPTPSPGGPADPTAHVLFVSDEAMPAASVNTAAAADQLCSSLASGVTSKAPSGRQWIALASLPDLQTSTNMIDRIVDNRPVHSVGGVKIVDSVADLFVQNAALQNMTTQTGVALPGASGAGVHIWTFTKAIGQSTPPNSWCNGGPQTTAAVASPVAGKWIFDVYVPCTDQARIYCISL